MRRERWSMCSERRIIERDKEKERVVSKKKRKNRTTEGWITQGNNCREKK